MANSVLSTEIVREGQTGEDAPTVREYEVVYRVMLETIEEISYYALYASSIPSIGDAHPIDSYATVKKRSVSQYEGERIVLVTVKYSTAWDGEEALINKPAQVNWSFVASQQTVEKDVSTGKPITNSAGELLVPGIEQDFYSLALEVTRHKLSYNPVYADTMIGKVNSDAVTICGLSLSPRQALLKDFSGSNVYDNGAEVWEVHYLLEFNHVSFVRNVLDHGFYYYDSNGDKQVFRDGGEAAIRPHLLNGSGGKLADGANAVFLNYHTREEAVFAGLGLDI